MLKHSPRRRTCHWRKLDILRCTSRCRPLPDRLESEAEEPRPCHRRSCRQRDGQTHSHTPTCPHTNMLTPLTSLRWCIARGWGYSGLPPPEHGRSPSPEDPGSPPRLSPESLLPGVLSQDWSVGEGRSLEITWHLFLDLLQLPLTVRPCFLVVSISYI